MNILDHLTRKDTVLLLLFVASGFCGLLSQVIWLRLAFGSWAGGKWIGSLAAKAKKSAIWFYAATMTTSRVIMN